MHELSKYVWHATGESQPFGWENLFSAKKYVKTAFPSLDICEHPYSVTCIEFNEYVSRGVWETLAISFLIYQSQKHVCRSLLSSKTTPCLKAKSTKRLTYKKLVFCFPQNLFRVWCRKSISRLFLNKCKVFKNFCEKVQLASPET